MNKVRLLGKRLSKFFFNRIIYVGFAVSVQVAWFVIQVLRLANYSDYINMALTLFTLVIVFLVMNREMNSAYKILWTALILAFPIFGLVCYLLAGESRRASKVDHLYNATVAKKVDGLHQNGLVLEEFAAAAPLALRQVSYLCRATGAPLYGNTTGRYFRSGEEMFPVLLEEIEQAKHYIFMEYFIINYGEMWDSVLAILERKAKEGVDVRIIYDDFGCMTTLPINYFLTIRAKGISCEVFNPFRVIANIVHNNRDHRKLCIIDGHTGFTGGINLSDEYIGRRERFGNWKDSALMLKGEAVFTMTVLFLQMWNVVTKCDKDIPSAAYLPSRYVSEPFSQDGLYQPFGDSPLDNEKVGQNVYLNILNQAKRYVYICTPYLIIDEEMSDALCLAAKSGVDVRIMTPGIPDKKIVYLLTQSYYTRLVRAGVKIFTYQPGFLHAKSFVCDDELAVLGSINLDYRSLYLHFENGVWMYGSPVVAQVKADFLETLRVCREITLEDCLNKNIFLRGMQSIFRVLAPLL